MTTPADAKRVVVISSVGTGVLTVIAVYKRGGTPQPRIAVGVLGVGVILATVAEFAPELARDLAALILVTAVFVIGGDAWSGLAAATSPKGTK